MKGYIFQRVVYMVITLLLIASATFFLMKVMPGTPLSNAEKLTAEQEVIILEKYGLNDPVPVQYIKYMANVVTGDLGVSFQFDGRGVTGLILDRIGPSAQLGLQAMIFGSIFGILLGIVSAIRYNTIWDYSATMIAVIGKSIPSFVFAALLQYYIGVKLQWFPVAFWEGWEYSVLPTIALATFVVAIAARFTRTEMLEVMSQDFITTARAKGVSGFAVVFKHGIRNALIPLVTIMGPLAIGLMTGSLVIENIFAIPGLGEQFVRSIQTNDYPVIMGTTLFLSFFLILIILIVDILYGVIDPRIRLAGGKD
ncbi:oligopeptide ABC transporter permease [Pseudalkalibacillus berkeleyi]|uniref:ABC transporter permease n=1 Tax=Pseudalkalibacillus berkeleyi TaxID=1069813 RepID=A0ABS9GZK9_9BACL|nr:oligopeptide ABC transporter permease [Pseudalkalibacillus berkeleyi]MCF6136840.1 ABC transporter permease [Pseudalkalibacillus berkeleyi]